jgi:hypothetical protein
MYLSNSLFTHNGKQYRPGDAFPLTERAELEKLLAIGYIVSVPGKEAAADGTGTAEDSIRAAGAQSAAQLDVLKTMSKAELKQTARSMGLPIANEKRCTAAALIEAISNARATAEV